jgi:hypothetical protein
MSADKPQVRDAIGKGYSLLMGRPADPRKIEALENLYDKALESFRKNPEAACDMNGTQVTGDARSQAAWVVVAGALLNMDEFITKN